MHSPPMRSEQTSAFVPDSRQAWSRLALALLIASIGGVGMWSVVVVLPGVQAEFAASRGAVSLAYTLTMFGFGLGGIIVGRITDRFGIVTAMSLSIVCTGIAYLLAGASVTLWQFQAVYFLIGLGTSATFAPLMAEASHWFSRYRGLAVTIVAAGNYVAGTVWPPLINLGLQRIGWRATHVAIGLFCAVTMTLLLMVLRARMGGAGAHDHAHAPPPPLKLAISTNALTALLCIAGVACCMAMAMPQVHIVAYCGDLGYGVAHGAAMLSLMLGCGVVSRVASGWIADMIGGLPTLLLSSALQCLTLVLYLGFDSLTSLYAISAAFGLVQGGIIPSYAFVVREYFPPGEAGARIGLVLMASLFGMALGGWMSGVIFDLTGSYEAAFANGVLWNLLNAAIATWLLLARTPSAAAPRRGSQGGAAASRA
ncbi:MAG: MFS transporter [Acidisphaera sp.]|nr:MFS transporter [Acidisphaera sp.]